MHFATLVSGVGTVSSSNSPTLENAAYVARPVPRTMALIVLVIICFLASVFLLFVLVQWMRDTKRKTTTRAAVDSEVGETRETKHPHIVGSRRAGERRDRSKVRSHGVAAAAEGSDGRGLRCNECERIAYERIARSFKSGKRN
jgi:hypothetical protein